MNFCSYTKWNHKIAWIQSLVSRAYKLCSPSKLTHELNNIRKFGAYNGFPKKVVNKIISSANSPPYKNFSNNDNNIVNIYLLIPYLGLKGEFLVKNLKKKLFRLLKNPHLLKFNVYQKTNKLSNYCSNKDTVPFLNNSHVIYCFKCPGCSKAYVGKTDNTLFKRTKEHGWTQKTSSVFKHFHECDDFQHIAGLYMMGGEELDIGDFQTACVRDNTTILYRSDNWLKLAFMECLAIKDIKPSLNDGFKATKSPQLF